MAVGLSPGTATRLGREVVDYLVDEGLGEREVIGLMFTAYDTLRRTLFQQRSIGTPVERLAHQFSTDDPKDMAVYIAALRRTTRYLHLSERARKEFGEPNLAMLWANHHKEFLGEDGMDIDRARRRWNETLTLRNSVQMALRAANLAPGAREEASLMSEIDRSVYLWNRCADELFAWRSAWVTIESGELNHLVHYMGGGLTLMRDRIEFRIARDAAMRRFSETYTPGSIAIWFARHYRPWTSWQEVLDGLANDPEVLRR